jgi:hypothetical protein
MRMRRIILSSMACPAAPHFSTLSHKRHDFEGKQVFESTICVYIISETGFKKDESEKLEKEVWG